MRMAIMLTLLLALNGCMGTHAGTGHAGDRSSASHQH